jgi:hypothetical protein
MRLCMFHPNETPLERGWVGRVDRDRVVHLAAQTLQSFFTGGASAREHAVYPLDGVTLLTPVLYPPSVRVFDGQERFAFANPAAVVGPGATVRAPVAEPDAVARLAAVVGAEGALGGVTACLQWRAPTLPPPKDADFGIVTGPVVVTPDELDPDGVELVLEAGGREERGVATGFDWARAATFAASGTTLRTGDIVVGPAVATMDGVTRAVTLRAAGIGSLASGLAA